MKKDTVKNMRRYEKILLKAAITMLSAFLMYMFIAGTVASFVPKIWCRGI